ncbi:hypothetical protein [Ralstonia soli]|uniref:CopG family transcriptional regulator n=1 Tax=Ralstonia soli TaxID=2953896 RepID=A0ABT1AIX3_9RALS|nr:hypothetical protein [Ralstonia soli]MCO5398331.1 hypothetical protein [Ralstonia soli]
MSVLTDHVIDMPSKKPRLNLTLDEDTMALLRWLSAATNVPETSIVNKLLSSHLSELWEYRTWLEQLPKDNERLNMLGVNLLVSYGPDDLVAGLKRLDPAYETMEEKMARALKGESK